MTKIFNWNSSDNYSKTLQSDLDKIKRIGFIKLNREVASGMQDLLPTLSYIKDIIDSELVVQKHIQSEKRKTCICVLLLALSVLGTIGIVGKLWGV